MSDVIETQLENSSQHAPLVSQELEGFNHELTQVNTGLDQAVQAEIVTQVGQAQSVESNPNNITGQIDKLTENVQLPEVVQNNMDNQLSAADKRYQENSNRLTELQERIERAERRSITAEPRIVSLEQDIRSAYVQMKSLIQSKETIRLKEDKYQNDIAQLQARLKAAQQRSNEAEADVGKMQNKIDQLQEKLLIERTKSSQTKQA